MTGLEEHSKKKGRRARLERIALSAVSTAGLLGIAAVSPPMLKALTQEDPQWRLKRDPRRRLREVAARLKRKGLIEFKTVHGRTRLRITAKGQRAANSIWRADYALRPPKHWDGKWRLVIFDIAERRRTMRDKIRRLLSRLGFLRLQDSVWVYPYDCEEVVTLLKADLKTGRAILYVIADAIEFDAPLRAHFNLSRS